MSQGIKTQEPKEREGGESRTTFLSGPRLPTSIRHPARSRHSTLTIFKGSFSVATGCPW